MATCISCAEDDAIPRECGLDLCEVCHPWVIPSLRRTGRLPLWAHILVGQEPDILEKVHEELRELRINGDDDEWPHTRSGRELDSDMAPRSDDAWLRYFRWLLGDEHELFNKMQLHVDTRADAVTNGISSVKEITDDLRDMAAVFIEAKVALENGFLDVDDTSSIPDSTTRMFGSHQVRMDMEFCRVDGILFYHNRRDLKRLAQFLFDSMNGLDTRGLGIKRSIERAPPLQPSGWTWDSRLPKIPLMLEHISLLTSEYQDRHIGNRHRAALLLWHHQRNREFMTRDESAWERSFRLLRSVIESNPDVVLEETGISVRGRSGTKWRIDADRRSSMGNLKVIPYHADNARICIVLPAHVRRQDYPLGDIVISFVRMLLDDIKTSEFVETLVPHMRQPNGGEEE